MKLPEFRPRPEHGNNRHFSQNHIGMSQILSTRIGLRILVHDSKQTKISNFGRGSPGKARGISIKPHVTQLTHIIGTTAHRSSPKNRCSQPGNIVATSNFRTSDCGIKNDAHIKDAGLLNTECRRNSGKGDIACRKTTSSLCITIFYCCTLKQDSGSQK